MSIQAFINENGDMLKTVNVAYFFERFTNTNFEIGIEIDHVRAGETLMFITIERSELQTFCLLNRINWITYFPGDKTKMIVRLSMKLKIDG